MTKVKPWITHSRGKRSPQRVSLPTPVNPKMVSVKMAPLSRPPSESPMIVTTGSRALRMAWRKTTVRSLRPFAGRAHVVETHHFEEARASHAGDDRHRHRSQDDGRQNHVPGCVATASFILSVKQPVDQVHLRQEIEDGTGRPAQGGRPQASAMGVMRTHLLGSGRMGAAQKAFL